MTGNEPFHIDGDALHLNVLSFWQWSSSDLVGNALRGKLAEFIVASAVDSVEGVRREWDAVDIRTSDGVRVEVKSSAYLQSWSQKKHSVIQFGIQPTQGWDASTNTYSNSVTRQSDVYVFCVLSHMRKETIDPLNLRQWRFFVVATKVLNQAVGAQKTITLSSLSRLHPIEAAYENVAAAIKQALIVSGRSDR
jgi:hypothetical protein